MIKLKYDCFMANLEGFNMNEKSIENVEDVIKESIYHYCGFNTFFTIIKNKTIRLSDVTQSNDHDEIKWSAHIIKNAFDNYYDKLFKTEKDINIAKEIGRASCRERV